MGHRLAQAIGLARREPGADPGKLHQLLLEDGDPEGLLEDRFRRRMRVADILFAVPTPEERMDGLTLDRAGPDEGHFDRQVVERSRLQLRKGRHLRPGFDLEDPDGVGPGHQVVYDGFLRDGGEVDVDAVCLRDHVDGQVHAVERTEGEQIELDDPHRCTVVLVPLENGAILHPSPLHRHRLPERTACNDHATRVDTEMTREPVEAAAHVNDEVTGEPFREVDDVTDRSGVAGIEIAGESVDLSLCESERLADVLEHRPGTVCDDVGDHRCSLPSVTAVAVLDDLLPAFGFEIDVDVRWSAALGGEEPFEREVQPDRVDTGQPETSTDRGVGPRSADLAVDAL